MGSQPAFALGLEIKKVFDLPRTPPVAPTPASPVKIGYGGKISVKGTGTPAHSQSKAVIGINQPVFQPGRDSALQAEFEQSVKTEFCDVKFKEQIRPGELSKIGIEFVKKGSPITVELAANADYTRPISFSFKLPNLVKIEGKSLQVGGVGIAKDWLFTGTLEPQLDINIAMNELWPGWTNVLRLMAQQTRAALQTGASAVRAVYFAGELGTVTTVGAAATASAVAMFGVAWIAYGMYQCGKALHDGRSMAVRYAFSNGYARMLAELTSDHTAVTRNEAAPLLAIPDWKSSLARVGTDYVNGANISLVDTAEKLGKAAILQDVDQFIKTKGLTAWEVVRKNQQRRCGAHFDTRRKYYLAVLYSQVEKKNDTLGIALA